MEKNIKELVQNFISHQFSNQTQERKLFLLT